MPRQRTRTTSSGKPTDSECMILSVLWAQGPATVREVFEELNESHGMGYTTVLKFMQIMTEKGLLERDTTVRPQVYQPAETRQTTQRTLVSDLLDRAFAGSPGTLALQALAMRKSTPKELAEIRTLLDKLEASS
ncbi:MAG: transcriptional regulator [Planctomycetes bacterium TMED75]|nr:transcriptional regulator [Planctomycetaceae bacterium]OUU93150.1 MAG: transcriptional regulator [Planctomycetes bacterium TMED75]